MENEVYISKIGNIVGQVKNVTFEVIVKDINIMETNDEIIVVMEVQDETGTMKALLGGAREQVSKIVNTLNVGDKYRIRANVTNVETNQDAVANAGLDNDLISGRTMVVRSIDKV